MRQAGRAIAGLEDHLVLEPRFETRDDLPRLLERPRVRLFGKLTQRRCVLNFEARHFALRGAHSRNGRLGRQTLIVRLSLADGLRLCQAAGRGCRERSAAQRDMGENAMDGESERLQEKSRAIEDALRRIGEPVSEATAKDLARAEDCECKDGMFALAPA